MADNATVIAWITLALTLIGGLLALLRYVNTEIEQERLWRERADEDLRALSDKRAQDDQSRYTLVYQEFLRYQQSASDRFVSKDENARVEERFVQALDKMSDRLETAINELRTVSVELAKISKPGR